VQLSGNTCTITNPGALLPRRNLQVLQPPYEFVEHVDAGAVGAAIRRHLVAFDVVEGESDVALAFRWRGAPSHERIAAFAAGVCRGLPMTIAKRRPLYIMLDGDVAQTLGAVLREEMGVQSEILAIDGVTLQDFDYVDLGKIRLPSMTVPVTIKSLIFREDPRTQSDAPHLHQHEHHRHGEHGHHHHDGHGHGHGHHHHHRRTRDR
jgi:ethanolamine utilization protein EutA